MPIVNRIFFIGFRGCGKTTIGKAVAEILGYEFIDLDELLVKRLGMSLPEFAVTHGEDQFRDREFELIKEMTTDAPVHSGSILAFGGGFVDYEKSYDWLKNLGAVIVYLHSEPEALWERLTQPDAEVRVGALESLGVLKELLIKRHPYFAKLATITVKIDSTDTNQNAKIVVDEVLKICAS